MNKHVHQYASLLLSFLLILGIVTVFWPVSGYEFLNYDDNVYVTDNIHVCRGLTWDNVCWAFTATEAGFWHPLTWLSLMGDCALYRLNPGGYHWTNVLLHIASTMLLFMVLNRMTGSLYRSGFVAALFALHPLHVEPVAWIAARKDVLSTFFWMLTMWVYVSYVERPVLLRYLLVVFVFVLGLMSKPMVVTLPLAMLLLDYWPLGRFPTSSFLRLVLEKLPLIFLAAAVIVVTYATEQKAGALISMEAFPLDIRVANALISYVTYLGKTIWPMDLAIFYPHPGYWPLWQIAISSILLLFITFIVLYLSQRLPYLAVGWFWYLGVLVPVIGLIQIGSHAMADRYTYIPLIGIFVMISWGGTELLKKWKCHPRLATVTVVMVLSLLLTVTAIQVRYWQDSIALFKHAADVADENYLPYYNLGIAFRDKGSIDASVANFKKALQLKPDLAPIHNNLGVALSMKGDLPGAIAAFQKAIQLRGDHAGAHNNLAMILYRQNQLEMSSDHFQTAVRLQPNYANAHYYLALVFAHQGLSADAWRHYRKAVQINPAYGSGQFQADFLKK